MFYRKLLEALDGGLRAIPKIQQVYEKHRRDIGPMIKHYRVEVGAYAKANKQTILEQRTMRSMLANDAVRARAQARDEQYIKRHERKNKGSLGIKNVTDYLPFKSYEFEIAEILSQKTIAKPAILLEVNEDKALEIVEACCKRVKFVPKLN